MIGHCLFQCAHFNEAGVADVLLSPPAREVGATIAFGQMHAHPRFATRLMALTTPDAALWAVMVSPPTDPDSALTPKMSLNLLEELVAHQRFVTAWILLVLEAHVADLVPVPKQFDELGV